LFYIASVTYFNKNNRPLRKLSKNTFKVVNTANKRHSQTEAFTPVSVFICQYFEYFKASIYIFNKNTLS